MIPYNKMTFSGLERLVMIFQLVSDSDELLSPKDRLELMHDMVEAPQKWTPEQIALECKSKADQNSGDNMISSMILRDACRGY